MIELRTDVAVIFAFAPQPQTLIFDSSVVVYSDILGEAAVVRVDAAGQGAVKVILFSLRE